MINAVLEREWRIVHVAGHGEAPERLGEKDGNPRGVVLSDGAFLGPREIECMRTVPELVFVNCCHLAGRNINQLLSPDQPTRAEFAAGVAEALISIGVRCVIAAGWAVDDDPANAFATSFYTALVTGCRFIDAVAQAREDARRLGGNTWAAYQCYGDPDWRYRPETGDAQRPTPPADEFAAVSSSNSLLLALETLAVRSEYQHADPEAQARKIRYLETAFGGLWGTSARSPKRLATRGARAAKSETRRPSSGTRGGAPHPTARSRWRGSNSWRICTCAPLGGVWSLPGATAMKMAILAKMGEFVNRKGLSRRCRTPTRYKLSKWTTLTPKASRTRLESIRSYFLNRRM